MKFYIVTGRIDGDDDDCAFAYEAASADGAELAFRAEMAGYLSERAYENGPEQWPIYVTTIAVSDSPIAVVPRDWS